MEEQVQAESPAVNAQPSAAPERAVPPSRIPHEYVSPGQLRGFVLEDPDASAYDRGVVDLLLGRAADTIDELVRRLKASRDELERLKQAPEQGPESNANELLDTVQRVLANAKEQAAREAEAVRAEARAQVEESERLRAEATHTLEAAQASAAKILEEARSAGSRLVNESVGDIARLRDELEADKQRLEAEIGEVRAAWAQSLGNALARVEAIRATLQDSGTPIVPDSAPPTVGERHSSNGSTPAATTASEPSPPEASGSQPRDLAVHRQVDVVAELRHRLSAAEGSDSAEPVR